MSKSPPGEPDTEKDQGQPKLVSCCSKTIVLIVLL